MQGCCCYSSPYLGFGDDLIIQGCCFCDDLVCWHGSTGYDTRHQFSHDCLVWVNHVWFESIARQEDIEHHFYMIVRFESTSGQGIWTSVFPWLYGLSQLQDMTSNISFHMIVWLESTAGTLISAMNQNHFSTNSSNHEMWNVFWKVKENSCLLTFDSLWYRVHSWLGEESRLSIYDIETTNQWTEIWFYVLLSSSF